MRACVFLSATALLIVLGGGAVGCGGGGSGDPTGGGGEGGTTSNVCGPQTAPGPSGGANFPFPQHRLSASCGYPTNCSDADVQMSWDTYKSRMIVGGGSGLRVQRIENGNDTVSEGIAYGMIFAVYMGDKATFDGLWTYEKAHRDGKGLMNWHIDANGNTVGNGAATDADEDMAFALIMADRQWGGYANDASTQVAAILANEVSSSNVLLPDDSGNMGTDLNPSYFAPAYYKIFQTYNSRWSMVVDQTYTKLELCANDTTGLVPDWCTQAGMPSSRGMRYYYDATRTPYRIAQDACWNNDSRAVSYLAKVAAFFNNIGPNNITDGYNIDGSMPGTNVASAFEGPAGTSAMPSGATYASFIQQIYVRTGVVARTGSSSSYNYYNGSWALMTLMLMTGNMTPL
jgi:endo-1,4-beta-D-glucanase Y